MGGGWVGRGVGKREMKDLPILGGETNIDLLFRT